MAKWPTEYPEGPGFGRPTFPVICKIERDEFSVGYQVRVGDSHAQESAFEEGEGEICVWSAEIHFGMTDATVAGGAAFVHAAREQQRIADEWAEAIRRAERTP